MARMMARLASILAAVSAFACADKPATVIDPDSLPGDLAFALSLTEGNNIVAWDGPVGLSDETEISKTLELETESRRILVASWTVAQLSELSPRLRLEQLDQMDLAPAGAECAAGAIDSTGTKLDVTIPQTELVLFEDGERTAIPDAVRSAFETQLVVRLPVNAESCSASGRSELEFVTPTEFPLQVGTEIHGKEVLEMGVRVQNTHRLEDGRIVVAAAEWLYVVEPGKPVDTEGPFIFPLRDSRLSAAVVDDAPERNAPGTAHIIGVGSENRVPVIYDFRLDELGITLLRTTPVASSLQEIALNPVDGRIVATSDGQLVTRSSSVGGAIQEVLGVLPPDGSSKPVVGYTGWSDRPFVAGGVSRGFATFSSADGSVWTPIIDGLDPSIRLKSFGSVGREGTPEVWAGASNGRVFRLSAARSSKWEPVEMLLPPTYDCGMQDTCGWQRHVRPIRTITSVRQNGVERVFLGVSECTALLEMRADESCATFHRIPGRDLAATFSDDVSQDYRALDIGNGWLTLGGGSGGVYQLRLGD